MLEGWVSGRERWWGEKPRRRLMDSVEAGFSARSCARLIYVRGRGIASCRYPTHSAMAVVTQSRAVV